MAARYENTGDVGGDYGGGGYYDGGGGSYYGGGAGGGGSVYTAPAAPAPAPSWNPTNLPQSVGSRPTGQFFLDYTTGRVYDRTGTWLESPDIAFAAGVARDWSNLNFIFGPYRPPATRRDEEPPIVIDGGGVPVDRKPTHEEEDPTRRVADILLDRLGAALGGGSQDSEPRTVTTYSPAGGGSSSGGFGVLGLLLVGVAAFFVYRLWQKNRGGSADE